MIAKVDEKIGYVMREAFEKEGKTLDYETVKLVVALIGRYLSEKEAD